MNEEEEDEGGLEEKEMEQEQHEEYEEYDEDGNIRKIRGKR